MLFNSKIARYYVGINVTDWYLPDGDPFNCRALPKIGRLGGPGNVRNAEMNRNRLQTPKAINATIMHNKNNVMNSMFFFFFFESLISAVENEKNNNYSWIHHYYIRQVHLYEWLKFPRNRN